MNIIKMKNDKTLPRNLQLGAVLFIVLCALLMTPQDARAVASVQTIRIDSTPNSHGFYEGGDTLTVTVVFTGPVYPGFGATEQIKVKTGTRTRKVKWKSGHSRHSQVFEVTLGSGSQSNDMDGIEVIANSLEGNFRDSESLGIKAADLSHGAYTFKNHKVDTVAPTVSSVGITSSAGSDNTYIVNDTIKATVTFSEKVAVTGTPTLTLKVGSARKTATYEKGNDTAELVFVYTVAAGDADADGIEIVANQLSLSGGTIKDYVDRSANLNHSALSTQSSHKVDAVAPTVSSVGITSSAGSDNAYTAGDTLQATVTFSKNMAVTGTPQLTLKIGADNKTAAYTSGTGTKKLVFAYTVAAGDTDTDGIEIEANKLTLNSGTIKDSLGNTATLRHAPLSTQSSHKVDTTAPTIATNGIAISSTPASSDTYKISETIQATVTFQETVVVTGTPQLTLKIGSADRTATYKSGSNSAKLVFEYTAVLNDLDTDGISVDANSFALNGSTIKDIPGNVATNLNHAALSAQSSHKVDAVVPTVSSIAMSSTASNYNNHYKPGDKIQATVTFSESVAVTGTPQLTLTIGSEDETAAYQSGTGTTGLVFEYTVVVDDFDADGISIAANTLVFNGGTIKDTNDNSAILTHTALATQISHKVDGIAPVIPTNGVHISSSAGTDKTYKAGDKIGIMVFFGEKLNVTGRPQLTLKIGTEDRTAVYKLNLDAGDGTSRLIFEYTVASGDTDTDGIEIAADQLSLNGATLKDYVGNDAILTHAAVTTQADHKVDTTIPTLRSLEITSDAGTDKTYVVNEKIQATVTFSEKMTVTRTPQLTLRVGTADKTAAYRSGSGTTELVFEYTVAPGDTDTDGIEVAANQLTLNGGTITDIGGNAPADLNHAALTAQVNHKVDGTSPQIVTDGIKITSDAGTDKTYRIGEKVQITVTFAKNVTVTGTPHLTLTIGTANRTADYASGSGTQNLIFEYTVAEGYEDTDGIEIAANSFKPNGGTITDAINNAAILTHPALPTQPDHKIDASKPSVTRMAITSTTQPYSVGEKVHVTVTFNENVTVTGTPQLTLKIGTANRTADYESGSGVDALVFGYTVAAGDTDADGISIEANKLALNGGTIKDPPGNDASLTHTALSTQTAHKVETTPPAISGIAITSTAGGDNHYKIGDTIQATMTLSETVVVTGTPQLTLKIGTANRTADYASGTGTQNLVFGYTVAAGDTDADGIEIEADMLAFNNGTITDLAGNAVTLTHAALPTQPPHKVDGILPTIAEKGIKITSTTAPYSAGEKIQATVKFREVVHVVNVHPTIRPQLTLKIGLAYKKANLTRGSGTQNLVFEYTVEAGDTDTDGIEIEANQLSLNKCTLKDTAGNDAILTHLALPTQPEHQVDAAGPGILTNGIAITSTPANDAYKIGDTIQATVTFTENVTVTGAPTLTLKIGTEDKNAAWTSGSGTPNLVFGYRVAIGDTDTDGISIEADTLRHNGGTIKDATNNDATLTHAALTAQAKHKVDTTTPRIVTDGIAMSSTATNGTYKTGNTIQVTVTFTENMKVIGTPQLALKIGTTHKTASYASGNGMPNLVFEYTVEALDIDTDGIEIEANQLTLPDETVTLTDTAGNPADLRHTALIPQVRHKVEATTPGIVPNGVAITSTAGTDGFYTTGDQIQATVTFSKNVNVTNTPQLTLKIGTMHKRAYYTTGHGTAKLVFEYTVVTGDTDADGIEIGKNQLALNNGTIKDAMNNEATLTHTALSPQASHKVDAAKPTVTPNGIAIISTPSNNTYDIGKTLEVRVTFNEKVTVTGGPTLAITIGATHKNAAYTRGSSTPNLVFGYTVATGDVDTDGISIAANQLVVPPGATIRDGVGNDAILSHPALPTQTNHKVGQPPKVSSLAITSRPSNNGTYKTGEKVQATVTFTETVMVTGTPQLTLKVGAASKPANYASGTGTSNLVFGYTVAAGDVDTDGISVDANQLTLNTGTITDTAGNAATLTHDAISAQTRQGAFGTEGAFATSTKGAFATSAVSLGGQIATPPSHKVDGLAPSINRVAITSTAPDRRTNTYKTGEIIQATVTFSEPVIVTGIPQLTLKIGNAHKAVNYTGMNGNTALVFEYTVVAGDTDTDGISIGANQLTDNGGAIKDIIGNAATLTHSALPKQPAHKVVTTLTQQPTQPTVSSVALTSTGPYGTGSNIEVTVSASQSLTVTGTPTLTLVIGSTEKTARYNRGTGSSLVFSYTVVAGDTDADGVAVKANSLALAGGTLNSRDGTALALTHSALPNAGTSHAVDTTPLQVSSLALTSTGPYGSWGKIEVTATTTRPVTVTGNAILTLILGNTEKSANYQSGSGTSALVFSYTVATGDGDDPDGVSVKANSLSPNGGTLLDEFGNALNLNHDALRDGGTQHRVDTTPPQVSSLAFTSSGPYGVGSIVQVTATTSEIVTITGTPSVTLVIGNTDRPANYMSGTGTTALVFQYKITAADKDDTNGISLKANSLKPNGGTMTDAAGNPLTLNHSSVANAGGPQAVGMTISGISSIAITSTGPYRVSDIIKITVTTAEQATVTGTPRIPMTIGKKTAYANYVSGTGTTALVFQYTVADGDEDTDGIEIAQNVLEHYNGSVIKNSYHTDLDLSHPSVAADAKHTVDTAQPTITGVTFAADAPAVYTAGTTLEVVVTFAETGVQVTPDANGAMPSLSLLFGSNADPDSQKKVVEVPYTEARPGSTKLVFTYTITADTPIDADGVQIQASSLKIPAGVSIVDSSGNPIAATPTGDGSSLVGIKPASQLSSRPILPAVAATGIIFNEFFNASTDKQDWVELRNTTDSAVSLAGWKLSISTGSSALPTIVALPDMMIPGGSVLLLMNTGHKETHLERSNAYTYRSLKLPELRLRGSDFSLMLRDRSGAVVDVISNYAADTGTFARDAAYFRAQPSTPGYEAAAWQASGYQGGLGYDRKAPKDTSLGTPGYLQSALTSLSQEAPVSISEVMFTTGTSGRLPQWIELYNASKTEVVTLQGWRFQVEVADLSNQPTHRFVTLIIDKALRILPNQTVLVVAKGGRNSQHFPEARLYNLTEQNPEKADQLGPNAGLLGDYGYAIVLRDESGNQVDIAGNLDGESSTSDVPSWKLPNCITANGFRTSLIRHYEDGMPLKGNKKSSWFRATEMRRQIITYYGHPKDLGNPGWKKGGSLPVQLSSFRAERTEQGALIEWTTGSELENAGFNVLRSESKTGTFTVVTPRMLQGAGTTSERSTYQYMDTTAKENVAYYYRLEEVSYAGVRQPIATRRLRGHVSAANRYLTTFGSLKKLDQ